MYLPLGVLGKELVITANRIPNHDKKNSYEEKKKSSNELSTTAHMGYISWNRLSGKSLLAPTKRKMPHRSGKRSYLHVVSTFGCCALTRGQDFSEAQHAGSYRGLGSCSCVPVPGVLQKSVLSFSDFIRC